MLKNTQKELQSLAKKDEKCKDWKYLADLYKQVDEDKRKIESLEKDNKKLKTDQKKADLKLIKQINNRGDNLFNDEIVNSEIVELDNEISILRHKADYMQEKVFKEQ